MSNRSVLIVDDEKNIRLTLSMALEELNLSVDTAVNGEEALHMLAGKSYALILLDHNLTQNGCIIGPFASNSFALDSSYLADL